MWLTSRQTVGRQERINYCPLTVSFPALELSVAVPGGRFAAIFNFMHPFALTSHHHAPKDNYCPLTVPSNFRRIAAPEKRLTCRRTVGN